MKGIGAEGKLLHASYKMDGGSFSFEFQDGRLVAAISRGDGLVGEDVTANALKFRGIPAQCVSEGRPFQDSCAAKLSCRRRTGRPRWIQTLSLTRAIAAWALRAVRTGTKASSSRCSPSARSTAAADHCAPRRQNRPSHADHRV